MNACWLDLEKQFEKLRSLHIQNTQVNLSRMGIVWFAVATANLPNLPYESEIYTVVRSILVLPWTDGEINSLCIVNLPLNAFILAFSVNQWTCSYFTKVK